MIVDIHLLAKASPCVLTLLKWMKYERNSDKGGDGENGNEREEIEE